MAYQVDTSPLERSGIRQANMLQGLGQTIGSTLGGINRRGKQEEQQAKMQQLMQAAASGDKQAIEMLYSINPEAGKAMEQRLFTGQDRATKQEGLLQDQRSLDTANLIEKMSLMSPPEQKKVFDAAVLDDRFDIDASDEPFFMDPNAQRAAVAKVKGNDYANNFFGKVKERKLSSVQQKVEAEGIDPYSEAGFKRAREINQGQRTDPSLKQSDQQVIKQASEGQLASAGFANRVTASNEILNALEDTEGFDPTSLQSAAIGMIPLGNLVQSSEYQQYDQAKRDFITAVLRKESGAAIGADEFANEDKKFFPQIGDKPAVLERKRQGRARALNNLIKQSKGVYDVQFKSEPVTKKLNATTTNLSDADLLKKYGG